ncbi:hypothetical protein [Faecalibacterium sp. I4-1-79]|uniref:hypothetical protein n=1 Tax=Faecalibacterium sp. I4-1-79 TaxID=2929494 RepID=UPI002014C0AE|nr:hypothetical protein [Faecalibacterium sp. I4-1-79]UQK40427.1 hypothetical protein MTP36_00985 [Faecalibacterium sp. I4-1-79]
MKAKRIVSILLTGSMLLSLLPVSALAAAPVFENRGLISSGTYSQPVHNSGIISGGQFNGSVANNSGTISGGQFNGSVANNSGTISGGTFLDDVSNSGTISNGTFQAGVNNSGNISGGTFQRNVGNWGSISGGTFLDDVSNSGTISNGTFQRKVDNQGTIFNGTFQQPVNNSKTIRGGIFQGEVHNWGTISNGTFQREVHNWGTISDGIFQQPVDNHKTISGGTFQQPVDNYKTISGGTFWEAVEVNASSGENATIEGGTFEKGMKLANDDASITISDGLFDGEVFIERCRSPLSITGGLFTKAVNASSIDDPTNLQITGGYFVNKPIVPEGSAIAFTSVSDQNGGNFQVPVNDGFSESYTSLYVPSGSSEQPNTITVKTDAALFDCRAADADVSIMSSVVSKGGNTYEIPVRGYEKIVLVTEVPAPPTPDEPGELDPAFSSGAAALGIVLGTAGLGYATYVYGSSLYLHYALPDGFIPSTRQELANVLWTTAGKPDPVSTTLYTDIPADAIDQQKAARWCAEQGLLSDHGATFGPDTKVTNARIIRAWNSLKKVPVTITK